jgi:hypothetical protein
MKVVYDERFQDAGYATDNAGSPAFYRGFAG